SWINSSTAISASDTREDCPLVHCLISVRNIFSASAPAWRTACFNSAASLAISRSPTSNRQSLDANRRRVNPVLELGIVCRRRGLEDVEQVAGDGHLTYGKADPAVLDPEAARTAAVVASDAVDAGADEIGHVEAFLDIAHQFGRGRFARRHV